MRRPQPPCGSHRPWPLVGEGSVRDSITASGRILTVIIKDHYFVRFLLSPFALDYLFPILQGLVS